MTEDEITRSADHRPTNGRAAETRVPAGRRMAVKRLRMGQGPRFVLALALITTAPGAIKAQTTEPPSPRSCQRLHKEINKCETGMRSCNQHVITRLEKQCQRDEKRLP